MIPQFQLCRVSPKSEVFSVQCRVGKNETLLQTLIDTCAAGGNYINESIAQQICKTEGIDPFKLQTPLRLTAFNDSSAPMVTHAVLLPLQIGRHSKENCHFNITNLGRKDMIIGIQWMEEHGCIPNPVTRELLFLGGHCRHTGAPPVIPIEQNRLTRAQTTTESDRLSRPDLASHVTNQPKKRIRVRKTTGQKRKA